MDVFSQNRPIEEENFKTIAVLLEKHEIHKTMPSVFDRLRRHLGLLLWCSTHGVHQQSMFTLSMGAPVSVLFVIVGLHINVTHSFCNKTMSLQEIKPRHWNFYTDNRHTMSGDIFFLKKFSLTFSIFSFSEIFDIQIKISVF